MGWREVSDRIDGRKVWKETNCTTFRMIVVDADDHDHVDLWRLQTEREEATFSRVTAKDSFVFLSPAWRQFQVLCGKMFKISNVSSAVNNQHSGGEEEISQRNNDKLQSKTKT